MKVRALQPFVGPEGPVRPGDVVELDDATGAYLIRHGFAREQGATVDGRRRGATRARRASTSTSPECRSDATTDRDEDDDASGKA